MKKFLSLLLSLCLLLGALPMQVLALPGSIFPSEGAVKTVTLDDGSLSLQNEYIYMTFRKLWGTYAYLTVAPAAKPDEEGVLIGQTPRCTFITYDQGREKKEGVVTEPIKAEFVTKTPNGSANAIKVEYSLLTALSLIKAKATVYYELVQLKENGASSNDTWGVLASVGTIYIDKDSMPQDWNRDFNFKWGYSFNCFTATGHTSTLEEPGGPAIKQMRRKRRGFTADNRHIRPAPPKKRNGAEPRRIRLRLIRTPPDHFVSPIFSISAFVSGLWPRKAT